MSQPDSPHSPLSPFPEKRDPATMRRTTTKSEEEEIKELHSVAAAVLREKLTECGGKDEIYNGINLIENIKFLLKIKYSFIFSDGHVNDEGDDMAVENIALKIAGEISPFDTLVSQSFKYTHHLNNQGKQSASAVASQLISKSYAVISG